MANGTIGAGASAGAALGTMLGGPVGTVAGSLVGAGLGAIPSLVKSDAEKENERRLKELRKMQEMGTLGLTEAEKQAIYGSQQSAIQGQLQQAQSQIRAAGAAGMQGGAGTEQLKQLQLAEAQARGLAEAARSVEAKDLERKRELEDEIQQRIVAGTEYKQERTQALADALVAGVGGGISGVAGQMTNIQAPVTGPENEAAFSNWVSETGWAQKLSPDEQRAAFKIATSNQPPAQYNFFK